MQSFRELGAKLDISHVVAAAYAKREDWPFARRAPWPISDLPQMMRWRVEVLSKQKDTDQSIGEIAELRREKLRQELRKLVAPADLAERENKIHEGKYRPIEEMIEFTTRGLVTTRSHLLGLPGKVSVLCHRQDAAEVMAILEREIHEALTALSETFETYGEINSEGRCPECGSKLIDDEAGDTSTEGEGK